MEVQNLHLLRELLKDLILEEHQHRPSFSCNDHTDIKLPGIETKNLLLKANEPILCVLPCARRLNIKALKQILAVKILNFASADECKEVLGSEQGHLSVLGLLLTKAKVKVIFDSSLMEHEKIQLHPCINTLTWIFETRVLVNFLKNCGLDLAFCNIGC